jgi:hypothetical protein
MTDAGRDVQFLEHVFQCQEVSGQLPREIVDQGGERRSDSPELVTTRSHHMGDDTAATQAQRSAAPVRKGRKPKRFAGADGRRSEALRLRNREIELADALGGLAALSPADRVRVQSAAALSDRLEQVRSGLARGDLAMSDQDLVRLSNVLSRELSALDRLAAARRKATVADGQDALRAYCAEAAA